VIGRDGNDSHHPPRQTWIAFYASSSSCSTLRCAVKPIAGDFTPLVERISIDEAFAECAGCTHISSVARVAEIATAIADVCARS